MLKRLLNRSEQLTYGRLLQVCASRSAKVYIKVRVADVLPIDGSGLPGELFEFALQAHYDFVIARSDDQPLFAVELDGPTHTSTKQLERDAKKDELSRRFGLPLRRIRTGMIWDNPDGLELISEFVGRWLDESDAANGLHKSNGKAIAVLACPVCGSQTVKKLGKRGPFLSCARFPECRGSLDSPLVQNEIVPQVRGERNRSPALQKDEQSVEGLEKRAVERRAVMARPMSSDGVAALRAESAPIDSDKPEKSIVAPAQFSRASAPAQSITHNAKNSLADEMSDSFGAGYPAIPDWLQGILWGLGIASCLLLIAFVSWRVIVK